MCTYVVTHAACVDKHGFTELWYTGGIPCQISDIHPLHKIRVRTSCVIIFK